MTSAGIIRFQPYDSYQVLIWVVAVTQVFLYSSTDWRIPVVVRLYNLLRWILKILHDPKYHIPWEL